MASSRRSFFTDVLMTAAGWVLALSGVTTLGSGAAGCGEGSGDPSDAHAMGPEYGPPDVQTDRPAMGPEYGPADAWHDVTAPEYGPAPADAWSERDAGIDGGSDGAADAGTDGP